MNQTQRFAVAAGRLLLPALAAMALLGLAGCPPKGAGQTGGQKPQHEALEAGGSISLPLCIAFDETSVLTLDLSEPRLYALARCIEAPILTATPDGKSGEGLASSAVPDATAQNYTLSFKSAPGHEDDPGYLPKQVLLHWQKLLRGPDGPLKAQLADLVDGAKAFSEGQGENLPITPSGSTLQLKLTRPDWLFPLWLSQPGLGLLPRDKLPLRLDDDAAGGLGLFLLKSTASGSLKLEANPSSMFGAPRLSSITFVCEPDRQKQVNLFRDGKLDAANMSMKLVNAMAADPSISGSIVQNHTACQLLGLYDLFSYRFPWADQKFQSKLGLRQALNLGLDRSAYCENLSDQLSPFPHFLPESFKDAVDPALVASPLYANSPDIEGARAALKLADHEQGAKLIPGMDMAYLNGEDLEDVDVELLHYWNEISVKMRPFPLTRAELKKRLELHSLEIYLKRCCPAYPDPDACFYPMLSSNLLGAGGNELLLKDQGVDDAIAKIQAEPKSESRTVMYQQLGKTLEQQCDFVFVGTATPSFLISKRLGGYLLNPYDYDASLPGQDFSKLGVRTSATNPEGNKTANAVP